MAALQMDANPAPTHERITIADRLVHEAHEKGAQLVVLPELFNTGYGYTDANYERAETLSLFLLDEDEIYNALLLFAPDGRLWRYDKHMAPPERSSKRLHRLLRSLARR
jgi:predicted amidohydrolase